MMNTCITPSQELDKDKALRLIHSALAVAEKAGIDIRIAPINAEEENRLPRAVIIITGVTVSGDQLTIVN
jgi:hypothetical protein